MNKNGLYMGLMITGILLMIAYASYGMLNSAKETTYYSVSVIVEDSGGDRWNAFKEGLQQGADENHVYLNMVSTTTFASLAEEVAIISRELENGADGVIVAPVQSADEEGILAAAVADKAVVLIDTTLAEPYDAAYSVVSVDSYALGAAIAQTMRETWGDGSYSIGVLAGNQEKTSMQQRLAGFTDTLTGTGAETLWILSDADLSVGESLAETLAASTPDVLVALENDALELAIETLQENQGLACALYGEGRSEMTAYYLGKGIISAMVVADEYAMGYQALTAVAQQLERYDTSIRSLSVEFLTVTREEMYEDEVAKVLFPVV